MGGNTERMKEMVFVTVLTLCFGFTVAGMIIGPITAKRSNTRILSDEVDRLNWKVGTLIQVFHAVDPNIDLKLRIADVAAFYGLRADLLIECAERESQWDTTAINKDDGALGSDSYGLLQVKLPTACWILNRPELTAEELLRVDTNIDAGARYLKYCLEQFEGDEILGVAAYRRGPAAVKESLKELAAR